jgi:hypothetical protein
MDPDPDPGCPKTYGSSGSGFGYATLFGGQHFNVLRRGCVRKKLKKFWPVSDTDLNQGFGSGSETD